MKGERQRADGRREAPPGIRERWAEEKISGSERRDWAMCCHMTAARANGKVNETGMMSVREQRLSGVK